EVSDTYAPYGRMIPCETVITIDSAKIETPIIGFVTEDVWHDGKLIIPAGAEVHGKAQVDPSRERIASDNSWILVWRTTDRMNGAELPLHGVALDMERNETTGTWQLTDGSAGLKGDILKTDNWAEIKLFAATFLSAATTGLENTTTSSNALTGQTTQTPLHEYYSGLVKQHPERATRAFMLNKMFRHEADMRQTARQAPQAKEWLDQQEPSLKQRIMERLEKINPFYREKALVREIAPEKNKIDFTPKPSLGQGMSV